jgi:CRISPR-associated protein Cmr5
MTVIHSQVVASRAYARVEAAKTGTKKLKEYKSFALKFPALIHASGLVQATAFAFAKGGGPGQVLDDLADVLKPTETGKDLHQRARTCNVAEYLRLTEEALTAASWLKRYTEALLGDS